MKINLALNFDSNGREFYIEARISLYRIKIETEIGNRLVNPFFFGWYPSTLECVDGEDVPVSLLSKIIAIGCGGQARENLMYGNIYFPSIEQKNHFLFLMRHPIRTEKKSVLTEALEESSLDDIPFLKLGCDCPKPELFLLRHSESSLD